MTPTEQFPQLLLAEYPTVRLENLSDIKVKFFCTICKNQLTMDYRPKCKI